MLLRDGAGRRRNAGSTPATERTTASASCLRSHCAGRRSPDCPGSARVRVHRDLKPSNLMLLEGPEPMIKVIDFGLAKAAATGRSESDITHGGFVGTPSFASPEQFTNTAVDIRSDLYSLGR